MGRHISAERRAVALSSIETGAGGGAVKYSIRICRGGGGPVSNGRDVVNRIARIIQ